MQGRNVERFSQVGFHSLPNYLCRYTTCKSTRPFSGSRQVESKTKATSSKWLYGKKFQMPCLSPPKKYTYASRPVSNSAIISGNTASTIDKSTCIAVLRRPGRRRTRRQNAKFWQSFSKKGQELLAVPLLCPQEATGRSNRLSRLTGLWMRSRVMRNFMRQSGTTFIANAFIWPRRPQCALDHSEAPLATTQSFLQPGTFWREHTNILPIPMKLPRRFYKNAD
jgi:hypothetical protein